MKPGQQADALYIRHMLECIERIDEYVGGEEARFRNSRLIQDAVIRNLQTLAESSQRLSETIQAGEPEIAWRAIAGFRNILVHDYLGIDPDVIWRVIADELPRLCAALKRLEQGVSPPPPRSSSNQ